MKYSFFSRALDREVTFSRPANFYIYIDLSGKQQQICSGGYLLGSTIGYEGEDFEAFKRICVSWWRQYQRKHLADCYEKRSA